MATDTVQAPTESPEVAAPSFLPPGLLRREQLRVGRWSIVAAVSVLVLISLWLRTRSIHAFYWIDEGLSVGISSHPLSQIPSVLRQDGSPPLYYVMLHVWMAITGSRGEVSTHVLSLISALLTIPIAYWAGASIFDRRTGLVCAVLAASVPYFTMYAQETRMYALLGLEALLAASSFVQAYVLRRRPYIALFIVSLTAALYTHNWALFLALTCAVAFLLCVHEFPREQRRLLWIDGAIGFGGVAVLFAPWLPTLLFQAGHTGAPWDLAPVFWSLTQGLYYVVGGRGSAVALLLAGGTGLLALRARYATGSRVPLALKCLLIMGIGTLLTAWLYSKVTPAWADRYLAAVVSPLILVFGAGVARAGRLGAVALLLVVAFWVLDPIPSSRDFKSNVATITARLRPHLGSDPVILSTQPEQVPVIKYYLPKASRFGTPLGPVPDPRVVDWRDALARLRHSTLRGSLLPMLRSLTPGQRILLITPFGLQKTPLWLKLIQRDSNKWTAVLEHDRSLRKIASSDARVYSAGVAVTGAVYVVR